MLGHRIEVGAALASAVELAEFLAGRGVEEALSLLDGFFSEAAHLGLTREDAMVRVDDFYVGRYLVTNADYERMIPGHRAYRNEYSIRTTSRRST